jgi:putative membrane protein insertion efficiency factor
MRHVVQFLVLLPRNACVAILRAYRKVISPLYGDVCRYYPSCSQYALEAIQKHGAVRGIGLGAWRLVRCHPWAKGGIDDVPEPHRHRYTVTAHGFVTPRPAHVHIPEKGSLA